MSTVVMSIARQMLKQKAKADNYRPPADCQDCLYVLKTDDVTACILNGKKTGVEPCPLISVIINPQFSNQPPAGIVWEYEYTNAPPKGTKTKRGKYPVSRYLYRFAELDGALHIHLKTGLHESYCRVDNWRQYWIYEIIGAITSWEYTRLHEALPAYYKHKGIRCGCLKPMTRPIDPDQAAAERLIYNGILKPS